MRMHISDRRQSTPMNTDRLRQICLQSIQLFCKANNLSRRAQSGLEPLDFLPFKILVGPRNGCPLIIYQE